MSTSVIESWWRTTAIALALSVAIWCRLCRPVYAEDADLVLYDGKIAAVDRDFSIHEAMAIQDGRILLVGSNEAVLKLQGPRTEAINLHGRFVIPGLIDSHVHPNSAAMHEFDHDIPDMQSLGEVLD